MVDVFTLDSHLLQGLGSKQRSDCGDNGSVEALHDDSVSHLQLAVDQDNIDGGSVTFNDLDFKNCALKVLRPLQQLFTVTVLTQLAEIGHQVGETLAGDGRSGNQRDVVVEIGVLPVELSIQTLLSKGQKGLLEAVLELALGRIDLRVERVLHIVVLLGLPLEDSIDLV